MLKLEVGKTFSFISIQPGRGFSLHELEGSLFHSKQGHLLLASVTLVDGNSTCRIEILIDSAKRNSQGKTPFEIDYQNWLIEGWVMKAPMVMTELSKTPSLYLHKFRRWVTYLRESNTPLYIESEYSTRERKGIIKFDKLPFDYFKDWMDS